MENGVQISKVRAAGNRVVVKQKMDSDTFDLNGVKLYKAETYKDNTTVALSGEIVHVGKEVTEYKVGDVVLYHKYVGYDLFDVLNGDKQIYKVLPCDEIIAFIEDAGIDINEDSLLNNGRIM
jgi:co-chaperonin GroES (HSP10)